MKSTKFWVLLLAALAALALGGIALPRLLGGGQGHIARIYQDGRCIREIDLAALDAPLTFTVEGANGCVNTVTAQPGRIQISGADCPDQICVRQGWITTDTVPIVCLPNKLVIQIEGGGAAFDAATG